MTYVKHTYGDVEEAQADFDALARFGVQCGMLGPDRVLIGDGDATVEEWEVWAIVNEPPAPVAGQKPLWDTEPDEFTRGQSSWWDEDGPGWQRRERDDR